MKAVRIKDLKVGEFFTLKSVECPQDSQVYVRDYFDRSSKKYACHKFSDICFERFFKSDKVVYIDFIF